MVVMRKGGMHVSISVRTSREVRKKATLSWNFNANSERTGRARANSVRTRMEGQSVNLMLVNRRRRVKEI